MDYYAPGVTLLANAQVCDDDVKKASAGIAPYKRDHPLTLAIEDRTTGVTHALLTELGTKHGPVTWYELPAYPPTNKAGAIEQLDESELVVGVVGIGEGQRTVFVDDFADSPGSFLTRILVATQDERSTQFIRTLRPNGMDPSQRMVQWGVTLAERGGCIDVTYAVSEAALNGLYGIRCARVHDLVNTVGRLKLLTARKPPELVLAPARERVARCATACMEAFDGFLPPTNADNFTERMTEWLKQRDVPPEDAALLLAHKRPPRAMAVSTWETKISYLGAGHWSLATTVVGSEDENCTLKPPTDAKLAREFVRQTTELIAAVDRLQRLVLPHIVRAAQSYNTPL